MKRTIPILAMAAILAGCGDDHSDKSTTSSTNAAAANTAGGGNNSLNYLGTLAANEKLAVKTVDVASLDKALAQFNVQEGRFPKDLSELVPSYIAHVPEAPFGYKLNYDPKVGEVTVVKVAQP